MCFPSQCEDDYQCLCSELTFPQVLRSPCTHCLFHPCIHSTTAGPGTWPSSYAVYLWIGCLHSPSSGKWAVFRKRVMRGLSPLCLPNGDYVFSLGFQTAVLPYCVSLLPLSSLYNAIKWLEMHWYWSYISLLLWALLFSLYFPLLLFHVSIFVEKSWCSTHDYIHKSA